MKSDISMKVFPKREEFKSNMRLCDAGEFQEKKIKKKYGRFAD